MYIFLETVFFSATDAVVGEMSVSQHKKNEKKKNDCGFVIPVPKLPTLKFSAQSDVFKEKSEHT